MSEKLVALHDRIQFDDGSDLAWVSPEGGLPPAEAKDWAKRLVMAHNAHDELLAASAAFVADFVDYTNSELGLPDPDRLLAAIAKAKGGAS